MVVEKTKAEMRVVWGKIRQMWEEELQVRAEHNGTTSQREWGVGRARFDLH